MRPSESFIGQPIRSLQTMLRLIALEDPDLELLIPDGIYGPETMRVVSQFQRKHGLPVTGITDQTTWEAVVLEYDPARISQAEAQGLQVILNPGQVIRRGERHPALHLAQGILVLLSQVYGSIPLPGEAGILDAATADALAAFQGLNRLPMTGNLDKRTWKHLSLHYPLASNLAVGGSGYTL